MSKLPCVAIVGRPNVGKSSLLNALVGKRISIVQNMPGVTRDRVSIPMEIGGKYIELVDTGGYGFIDPDNLTEHIQEQIEIAMHRADVVLFIVDCHDGLTSADQKIAAILREENIKAVLVANKADGENADLVLGDFARLGLGTPIGVSALTGRNIEAVVDAIVANVDMVDAPTQMADPEMLLAIVGKRNAGKSTLVNAIAGLYEGDPNRVIVSEVPGTTRDSIDVRFEKDKKTLVVIDTAGVRKKRHMVTNDIEFYSFHRAQRSVRRADVVLMLIDGADPISEPDRKLGQYIAEEFKPVILVVNKWDLAMDTIRSQRLGKKGPDGKPLDVRDEVIMEEYAEYLETELPWLSYAPVAFTSAKDGKNIQRVIDLATHLSKQADERLGTGKLNTVIKSIVEERSCPTPSGNRLKVFYATQVDVNPPTIVLFVNQPKYVTEEYQRYVINRVRDLLPYPEVPIKLYFRGRGERGTTIDQAEGLESATAQAAAKQSKVKSVARGGLGGTPATGKKGSSPSSARPAKGAKPVKGGKPAHRSATSASGRPVSRSAAPKRPATTEKTAGRSAMAGKPSHQPGRPGNRHTKPQAKGKGRRR